MPGNATNDLLKLIEDELRLFDRRWIRMLDFRKVLEERFQREVCDRIARFHGGVGIFLVFAFNLFLVADWVLLRPHFMTAVITRVVVFTPAAIGLLLVARHSQQRVLREGAVAAIALIAVVATLYLGFESPSAFAFCIEPLILTILILLTTVFRIMPRTSAGAVILSNVAIALAMVFYYHLPAELWVPNQVVFTVSSLLMLTANYIFMRSTRMAYLMQLRSELQGELLSKRNHELRQISERDALTGLHNRYLYERHVKEVFKNAMQRSEPLSMVMVDVDHFKVTNDQFGHLYGDRVLHRVGALIQEGLRGEQDFAARYGGEEFIVLLPDTDLNVAVKVAERIRNLVQIAGSPAADRDAASMMCFTTVSCGVATMVPAEGQSPNILLEAADNALYRAKAEGRNRTCSVDLVLAL